MPLAYFAFEGIGKCGDREPTELTGFEMTSQKVRYFFSFAVVAGLISSCVVGRGGNEIDHATWTERGKTTLAPFKEKLMGALKQSLEEGPVAAIDVCQFVAPEIAQETGSLGVRVGRTSHKLRNERNAPSEWIQPLLDGYLRTPGKMEPKIVQFEDGGVGYVEPIYVKRICLPCHGSALSPSVASRIAEHYPRDEAQGFEEGDFRGLFWVEFREMERESD
jgi:hypothetical protein